MMPSPPEYCAYRALPLTDVEDMRSDGRGAVSTISVGAASTIILEQQDSKVEPSAGAAKASGYTMTVQEKMTAASDIASNTALAVISGLQGAFGLAMIRSVDVQLYVGTPRLLLAWGYTIIAATASVLSLYATLVFSLYRYYGHAAMAKNRYDVFQDLSKGKCFFYIKLGAFYAFILSFFMLVIDIIFLTYLHLDLNINILHIVLCAAVVGVFYLTVRQILGVASAIYGPPRLPTTTSENTDEPRSSSVGKTKTEQEADELLASQMMRAQR